MRDETDKKRDNLNIYQQSYREFSVSHRIYDTFLKITSSNNELYFILLLNKPFCALKFPEFLDNIS